ncbi:MAG: hypothetical protein ACLQBD_19785 [Syntrophobacteraceae bacterium]
MSKGDQVQNAKALGQALIRFFGLGKDTECTGSDPQDSEIFEIFAFQENSIPRIRLRQGCLTGG